MQQDTPQAPAPVNPLPSQQPQPAAMSTQPALKSSKKKPIIIGAIIAAVLVVAAVAYGVYAYMTNTPDYLLNRATEQFAHDAKSAVAAKLKFTQGNAGTGVSFSGDIAYRVDPANDKNGEAVLGIGSGNSRVTVTARVLDEVAYVRFGSLANLPNLMRTFTGGSEEVDAYDTPEFKSLLDTINEKWYSLDKAELKSLAESYGSSENVEDSVTPEDVQKVMDIYKKHKVLKPGTTFNDEDIDGVKSARFTLVLDANELKAFLTEVKNANLQSIKVTDADIADVGEIADSFNKSGALEVWIARDSQKLKQIKFSSTDAQDEGSIALTFVTDLPEFEKLEKPTDAKPFSELMNELMSANPYQLDATYPSDYEYYYTN